MTGSLFPRGDKVAAKILCYAPMPSSYSFLSFSFPSRARFYARCACPRNVPLYTRLYMRIFSSTPGIRISNLTNRGIAFRFKISSRISYAYSLVISIEERIVLTDAKKSFRRFFEKYLILSFYRYPNFIMMNLQHIIFLKI